MTEYIPDGRSVYGDVVEVLWTLSRATCPGISPDRFDRPYRGAPPIKLLETIIKSQESTKWLLLECTELIDSLPDKTPADALSSAIEFLKSGKFYVVEFVDGIQSDLQVKAPTIILPVLLKVWKERIKEINIFIPGISEPQSNSTAKGIIINWLSLCTNNFKRYPIRDETTPVHHQLNELLNRFKRDWIT